MYIDNEEVVSSKEFTINEEMLSTSSTILNNCYPASWDLDHDYVSRFYYPKDYSKCRIYNNDNLIFCGLVKNSGDISLNPRYPKYCSLQILDFKTLLSEGDLLDFVISNKTVLEAIQMVVNAISSYGFVLGNVNILNPDEVIGAYSTQNKTAYDVFQYLAEITQSRWTTRMIDENTVAIDFYDPLLMPRANDIEYTKEYFEENNINDISFSYGTRDYRNKQVILSDEVFGGVDYTETLLADGYNKTFFTSSNIGIIKKIIVNGEEKSFATNEQKDLGIEADFYYTPNNNSFESNSEDDAYSYGINIIITYTPIIKGRQVVNNINEIERINSQINRNGIISRYETRNDILNLQELEKIGQTYLKYKGSAEIILTISTTNNDLFNIGEITYFNAPIDDLKQDYMVKKKNTQIIANASVNNIWCTYELTSSYNSENAINYFDNQRNKTTGNIAEGETIVRNYDINNEADLIFENLNIEEITITNDNVLNCGLNSPFIS
jgi:hypothetical protein